MIDVADHTDLAYFYANKSNKRHLQGVELDDLYQSAMIGIWIASMSYDETKGAFSTYAHQYIEGEITNLIYKVTTEGGVRQRVPRVKEELFSDIIDVELDTCDNAMYEDTCFDDKYLGDYLQGLALSPNDKTFFVNMVKYGDTEATQLYMSVNNCSRQWANKVKKTIREKAQARQEEIDG